jgi:hypothetical protein
MSSLAARIQNIEIDIQEIKQEAITAQDVERLRGEVAALRVEMAGDRKMAERTHHSLDRIERLILEKGWQMTELAERMVKEARLRILKELAQQVDGRLSELSVRTLLDMHGIKRDRRLDRHPAAQAGSPGRDRSPPARCCMPRSCALAVITSKSAR